MQQPYHEDVLKYVEKFVSENSRPFVTTTDVSERFSNVSKRTIYDRLEDLVDRGELQKESIGANSTVWWPAGRDRV